MDQRLDLQPDFALRNGTCVLASPTDPEKWVHVRTSVAVKDGKIVAIGDDAHRNAADVFDATGLHVLPGAIDSQVHFREPGLTHKEDLESGTRGAVLGGITSVFEMPNTKPSTTTAQAFDEKLRLAKGRVWSDVSFFIGATPDNIDELGKLELHKNCCAIKIFMGSSTGSLLVDEEKNLREILARGRRRVAVHAEDEARLKERKHLVEGSNDPRLHPVWRDEQTALIATTKLIRLARETKRPVHVLHVTTAEEMAFLKTTKDIATVETCPQHLTLSAPECYERLGTYAQMNPPIRDARHQEALWKAINDGTVTVLGSDHAPHTHEEKRKPYPESPSGLTGVQTMLPLMLNHVNAGRLSLDRLVELLCRNNARLYNAVGKGEIKVGNDADFTVVDMNAERTIENKWIASKSAWTAFDGMKVKGWPKATIVRGQIVMREDQLIGSPIGQPIEFNT
ncbi:MAG TPA: dihydroorotase [Bdellovibrionales bacterium]|jgi:dihydroorotase|nr:dihydroorotase [Bdellovibrionales bacterium]